MEENERAEAEYEKLLNEVEAGASQSQVDASHLDKLRKEVSPVCRPAAHARPIAHGWGLGSERGGKMLRMHGAIDQRCFHQVSVLPSGP